MFGKIIGKAAIVLAGAVVLGYAEYRIKGGEPIRKLYKEVRNERLAAEAAAKAKVNRHQVIMAEGSVR